MLVLSRKLGEQIVLPHCKVTGPIIDHGAQLVHTWEIRAGWAFWADFFFRRKFNSCVIHSRS